MEYQCRYSLAGVRTATTTPHEALIEKARSVLSSDSRVVALFLVGGFAHGLGDPWSDVDLQVVVRDEAMDDLRSTWLTLVERITPLAHSEPFPPFAPGQPSPIGGICITPEWLHVDFLFRPASRTDAKTLEGVVPLFDRIGVLPPGPVPRPERPRTPFFPEAALRMVLYMLGNMVSAVGRNEPIPGSNGVILVRDIALVSLLLAENGIEAANDHKVWLIPFSKRLRPYLTDEQNRLLESLPPVAPTLDSIIEGFVAIAEAFFPRAKRLAAATGAEWPTAYEQATVAYFERSLGVSLKV